MYHIFHFWYADALAYSLADSLADALMLADALPYVINIIIIIY